MAVLITKAKITQSIPKIESIYIKTKLTYNKDTKVKAPEHEELITGLSQRKRKLAFIFAEIKMKDQDVKDFFFCGF